MKKLLMIFLIAFSAQAQVKTEQFTFEGKAYPFDIYKSDETATARVDVVILTAHPKTSLRDLKDCLNPKADYFLLNLSNPNMPRDEQEKIAGGFITRVLQQESHETVNISFDAYAITNWLKSDTSRTPETLGMRILKSIDDLCFKE